MIIEKAVLQKNPPQSTHVIWIKPTDTGSVSYVFNNGQWSPLKLGDDLSTLYTEDDTAYGVKEIKQYVDDKLNNFGALAYRGTIESDNDLPANANLGDTYVVAKNGTYAGKDMEIGDYLIWNGNSWDGLNGENQVESYYPTISIGGGGNIATVDGTRIGFYINNEDVRVGKSLGVTTNTFNGESTSKFFTGIIRNHSNPLESFTITTHTSDSYVIDSVKVAMPFANTAVTITGSNSYFRIGNYILTSDGYITPVLYYPDSYTSGFKLPTFDDKLPQLPQTFALESQFKYGFNIEHYLEEFTDDDLNNYLNQQDILEKYTNVGLDLSNITIDTVLSKAATIKEKVGTSLHELYGGFIAKGTGTSQFAIYPSDKGTEQGGFALRAYNPGTTYMAYMVGTPSHSNSSEDPDEGGKLYFPLLEKNKDDVVALKSDVDKKVDKENGEASNLTVNNELKVSDYAEIKIYGLDLTAPGAYSAVIEHNDTQLIFYDDVGNGTNKLAYTYNGHDDQVFYIFFPTPSYDTAGITLATTADIPTTDTSLDSSSSNPIANSAVKTALDGKVDASSGTATNLTVTNQLTVKNSDGSSSMVITPSTDGSASATSGGGTLLFPYIGQSTTETVATLSDLPTKTSDLTNDSGYITSATLTQLQYGTFSLASTSTAVAAQKSDLITFITNFGSSFTFTAAGTSTTVNGVNAYTSSARYIVYTADGKDSSENTVQLVCYVLAKDTTNVYTLINGDSNYAGDDNVSILGALLRA